MQDGIQLTTRTESHTQTKIKEKFTTTNKMAALPNSCENVLQENKRVGRVGSPS